MEHRCEYIEKSRKPQITLKKKDLGWIMKVYDNNGEFPARLYDIKRCPWCEVPLE